MRPAMRGVQVAALLGMLLGCTPRLDRRVPGELSKRLPKADTFLRDDQRNWIDGAVDIQQGEHIITIAIEPIAHWSDCVILMDRRLTGTRIVATLHSYCFPNDVTSETVYDVDIPAAAAMFRNLQQQVALGFQFVHEPLHRGNAVLYAVASGMHTGTTLDVNGVDDTRVVLSEVQRWRRQQAHGETISDADLAEDLFSATAFASPATEILLAISYFDSLCDVTYHARIPQSAESK